MAVVRASCPNCGDVRLSSEAISVYFDEDFRLESFYTFRCPENGEWVRKNCSMQIAGILIDDAQVKVEWIRSSVNEEDIDDMVTITEKLGELTPDDLLDFHLALTKTRLVAREVELKNLP